MVIGYNPSHSNVNSEVNAPFKILSTLLRFMKNEEKQLHGGDIGGPGSSFGNFKMPRKNVGAAMDSGERLDTMEGFNDLYDEEEDEDEDFMDGADFGSDEEETGDGQQ